jgi:hypothetical protein
MEETQPIYEEEIEIKPDMEFLSGSPEEYDKQDTR